MLQSLQRRQAHAAGNSSNPAAQRATAESSDDSELATASRDASELTAGAEKAAKDMTNLFEDQLQQPVRSKAGSDYLYTTKDFLNFSTTKNRTDTDGEPATSTVSSIVLSGFVRTENKDGCERRKFDEGRCLPTGDCHRSSLQILLRVHQADFEVE